MDFVNNLSFGYESLEEAFPEVDPGVEPCGSRVLVQIRTAKKKTKTGLYIPEEVRDTEQYNTQVGKVIAVGKLAFHNRNTMAPWPEGAWCVPGDYVRVPKYGGDRWDRPIRDADGNETGESALFVIVNDLDIVGRISDPLNIKAFL